MGIVPGGSNINIALLHYPVYDKNREVVATAITNLDLHDIARSARTYGLRRYYVATPVQEQGVLAERIKAHWLNGWGASYNPKRREALELIKVVSSLDQAIADIEAHYGRPAHVVVTGAKVRPGSKSFAELAAHFLDTNQPYLLVFGTGWGLTEEIFQKADSILEPIQGNGSYNHLSVRSAVAIILDRLLGHR